MSWRPIENPPHDPGTYLVGNDSLRLVGQARYKPRLKAWTFPSASGRFEVTHWQFMPFPPGLPYSECIHTICRGCNREIINPASHRRCAKQQFRQNCSGEK